MKKLLIIVSILLIGLACCNMRVYAANGVNNYDTNEIFGNETGSDPKCKGGILTEDGYELVQDALSWLRILGPFTLLLMTGVDFFQAVVGKYSADGKDNALAKAKDNAVKRFIALILLIFVPTLVKVILGAVQGEIKIPAECVMIVRMIMR